MKSEGSTNPPHTLFPAQRPLPILPVVSSTHCSQDTVDTCVRYLERHNAELMNFLHEMAAKGDPYDFKDRVPRADRFLIEEAKQGKITVPTSFLGRVDMAFEISRRFERAYGLRVEGRKLAPEATPEMPLYENVYFVVKGKQLANHVDGPYPPLPPIPPILGVVRPMPKYGLTQEMANRILPKLYLEHGRIWFEIGEKERRSQHIPDMDEQLYRHSTAALASEFPAFVFDWKKTLRLENLLLIEATRLIRVMCGLSVSER